MSTTENDSGAQIRDEKTTQTDSSVVVIASVVSAFAVLLLISVAVIWLFRKKKLVFVSQPLIRPVTLSLSEISTFRHISNVIVQEELGSGNFGQVFRGSWT